MRERHTFPRSTPTPRSLAYSVYGLPALSSRRGGTQSTSRLSTSGSQPCRPLVLGTYNPTRWTHNSIQENGWINCVQCFRRTAMQGRTASSERSCPAQTNAGPRPESSALARLRDLRCRRDPSSPSFRELADALALDRQSV